MRSSRAKARSPAGSAVLASVWRFPRRCFTPTPDRSGYELMQELSATKNLRGIALSGFGMENDVSRARAAGFSEHLTKPINFDRLDEAIQMLLAEPEAAVRS